VPMLVHLAHFFVPKSSSSVSSQIVQILTQAYSSSSLGSLEYSNTLGICASPDRPPTLSFVFWGPLFFDLLLCSFTINHARKGWKSRPDYAVVPLLKVMYRGAYAQVMALAGRFLKLCLQMERCFASSCFRYGSGISASYVL
jgi:hypothetical protein